MIGEIIQKKRKELGFTQAQLAEMLRVSPPAVNRWEKNLSYPDTTLLVPLARCLKIDLNELFSFYDNLTDKERELIIKKINSLLMNFNYEEVFEYIEETLAQNLSDGILHKKIADILYSHHVLQKTVNPTVFLKEIAELYEMAMELLPEDTIDIAYSLLNIYSEMGESEKAEEMWSMIPDNGLDKNWVHIEMLYLLKKYDEALPELKRYILRAIIELINSMMFFKDTLMLADNKNLAKIAKEKEDELVKMFEINPIINVLSNMSSAVAANDTDSHMESIVKLLDTKKGQLLSYCPLFENAEFESSTDYRTLADMMNDLIS